MINAIISLPEGLKWAEVGMNRRLPILKRTKKYIERQAYRYMMEHNASSCRIEYFNPDRPYSGPIEVNIMRTMAHTS